MLQGGEDQYFNQHRVLDPADINERIFWKKRVI
jgi:hypothetical protein